jgi:hypothetical protein
MRAARVSCVPRSTLVPRGTLAPGLGRARTVEARMGTVRAVKEMRMLIGVESMSKSSRKWVCLIYPCPYIMEVQWRCSGAGQR